MKKEYINPTTRIVTVELQQFMETSQVGFGESVNSASVAEGRGGGFWDDDDEEY